MGYNQRNAKVDKNQPEIVKALRSVGAWVLPIHTIKNAFDILVGYKGRLFAIEIKNGNALPKKYQNESQEEKRNRLEGMLSEGEKVCLEKLEKTGNIYYIVSSVGEALAVIGFNNDSKPRK